tara:strand:+ start:55 stop:810 length:756 start_codon:yes stop_codon:yes gene_type:complete
MTTQEMHYDLKFKIDKVDSLDSDNFIPAELDWILNEAQEIFIKQRYGLNNSKKLGFEEIQKRTDDLRNLVIKSPTTLQPGVVPVQLSGGNTYEVKLSDLEFDYMFLIRGFVKLTKGTCTKMAKLVQQQHDDFNELEISEDPFQTSSFDWGVIPILFGRTDTVADDKGSIYLYSEENVVPNEAYIEYIKWPNRLTIGGYNYIDGTAQPIMVNSDFSRHACREIVDIAAAELSRIILSSEYLELKKQKNLIHE